MKTNTIILVAIAVLILVAVVFYFEKKKSRPDDNFIDIIFSKLGAKKKAGVVETMPGASMKRELNPDYRFFADNHYGEDYLSQFSDKDLKIMRDYIENYTRKGIKIQPSDAIYKDVIRINSYAKMFNDLPAYA